MSEPTTHMPRCNTHCDPDTHFLTDGIGYPHLHRTDVSSECGECATARRETDQPEEGER